MTKERISVSFKHLISIAKYTRDNYDRTEFEVAKSTIMILEDMCTNAEHINDLRTETVSDVYTTCKISRARIAKIVEVRSFANKLDDLESLLEVLDFMDKKMDAFKAKYNKLKAKYQKNKQAKVKEVEVVKEEEFPEIQEDSGEEQEEIGNIDLLELGLGDEPKKDKKKKEKKKIKKEKSEERQKSEEGSEEEREDKEETRELKKRKILAPPKPVRKLNSVNTSNPVDHNGKENNKPKEDFVDLLDFN